MSLTQLIAERGGPLRGWLESGFSQTHRVSIEANRFFRDGRVACPLPAPPASDTALVGTAADYLVRAHLTETALDLTVASHAGWRTQELAHKAMLVEQAAVAAVKELRAWRDELDQAGWGTLCTACALLAKLEQCFRAGPAVSWAVERALDKLDDADDFGALVRMTAGEATLVDLGTVGRAAVADHLDLREARVLHLNPTFTQSSALGGADADLIYDGTLLDFKATGGTQVVVRRVIWQLLGYALADTDDEFKIEAVGVSAPRWRRRIVWPLDELLSQLSPDPLPKIEVLRAQFASVAADAEAGLPKSGPARISRARS